MKVQELIDELNKFDSEDVIVVLKDKNYNAYIFVEGDDKKVIEIFCNEWEGETDGEDGQIIDLF